MVSAGDGDVFIIWSICAWRPQIIHLVSLTCADWRIDSHEGVVGYSGVSHIGHDSGFDDENSGVSQIEQHSDATSVSLSPASKGTVSATRSMGEAGGGTQWIR